MTKFTTIQNRHSAKWIAKITNVRAFTLGNCFTGQPSNVEVLKAAIAQGENLQISQDRSRGQLTRHSNCWYEFDLSA